LASVGGPGFDALRATGAINVIVAPVAIGALTMAWREDRRLRIVRDWLNQTGLIVFSLAMAATLLR
jgi:hypothetical protein